MIQITRLRAAARAAVVLFAAALAACSDAPTASTITADGQAPALNAAPQPTVTNSGGYPLISWPAVAGATSYAVAFNHHRTIIDKATLDTQTEEFESPLGTTTRTSYLDTSRAYTGKTFCNAYGTYKTIWNKYRYRVTASFPDGSTTTALVPAPVGRC